MSEDLEAMLRRVAAGELTPEEALGRLGEAPAAPASPAAHAATTAPAAQPVRPENEPVDCVRLKTSYRSVQVVTDPTVAQVHVAGVHSVQRIGSVLEVTTSGPLDDDERGAERGAERDGTPGAGRFSFSDLPRTIAWARSWRDHQLLVRINPAMLLELDVTGADVKLSGLEGGLKAHLVASSLKAEKMRSRFDVEAISSSVKLTAIPIGDSRLYCESSSVRLSMPTGTDLTITASNRMGRLVLPDGTASTLPFEGENTTVTIGDGRDQLQLEAVMSSVTVAAQDRGSVPA